MSRDYAKLERELIEELEARTGKDLAQWLAAIDAAALAGRNAIIDWLRPQGFSFSRASWLERIHHNGGRPIYLGGSAASSADRRRLRARMPAASPAARPPFAKADSQDRSGKPALPPVTPAADDAFTAVLARGKAFRPLAEMLLKEIARALPGTSTSTAKDLVLLGRPAVFGALLISQRELRLGLDLGDVAFEADLIEAKLPGAGSRMSHMIVLRDARQIDQRLIGLLRTADARVNPPPA